MATITLEEGLRVIEQKAALVRSWAEYAGHSPMTPEPAAIHGVGEVCDELEQLARSMRRGLDSEALAAEVRRANGR